MDISIDSIALQVVFILGLICLGLFINRTTKYKGSAHCSKCNSDNLHYINSSHGGTILTLKCHSCGNEFIENATK